MEDIRKVSVGPDYKQGMHYQVGRIIGGVKIDLISIKDDYIFIFSDKEVWKKISLSTPHQIEYTR